MTKCNICKKSFVSPQGVAIHQSCTPACGGTPRKRRSTQKPGTRHGGKRNTKVGSNGESGKEAIRRILSDHPQGCSTRQILDELKKSGFKGITPTYVSQTATKDSELRKAGRGIYRLKGTRQSQSTQQTGASMVQAAVAEVASETVMPSVETLLLRIEVLESQNRALSEAHKSLLQGVCA